MQKLLPWGDPPGPREEAAHGKATEQVREIDGEQAYEARDARAGRPSEKGDHRSWGDGWYPLSCLRRIGEETMQRQRGELVPIGEALGDLDGPV